MNNKINWMGKWKVTHLDCNGNVLWEDVCSNFLTNDGEENVLDTYLRGQNTPTEFYLRLVNSTGTSITETDSLGSITTEPITNGYTPQLITRNTSGWPTLALDSGDFKATSSEESFTAAGGQIGVIEWAYLSTTSGNSGKLLAVSSLTTPRTIFNGETLKISIGITLQ